VSKRRFFAAVDHHRLGCIEKLASASIQLLLLPDTLLSFNHGFRPLLDRKAGATALPDRRLGPCGTRDAIRCGGIVAGMFKKSRK
jgi:hypothetical protein